MVIYTNFLWLICFTDIYLVDEIFSKQLKVVVPKIESKFIPNFLNNTLLSFTYQIVNEKKYIKTIEPITANYLKVLNSLYVSTSLFREPVGCGI